MLSDVREVVSVWGSIKRSRWFPSSSGRRRQRVERRQRDFPPGWRRPLAVFTTSKYDNRHMAKTTGKSKQATHERIVNAAARAIRRSGYDGTSVADIMKEAGLTHGGFYAHFTSREAMLAEAADLAGAEAVAMTARVAADSPPDQALRRMVGAYLSKEHVNNIESGCPVAALGSEMPRQAPEVRRAATRRIKEMIDGVARQMPDWGQPGSHERALVTVSAMVGTLLLSRAVDDPRLSDELPAGCRETLRPNRQLRTALSDPWRPKL